MSIGLNTNIQGMNATSQLGKTQNALNTTFQRLSTGNRINSAKDDAAGLQISDRLLTQIQSLNQANRNANDAVAYNQIADSALSGTTDALMRMRDLAVQAANGTYTAEDRQALQAEMDQLSAGIDSTAANTTYNGEPILDGSGALTAQVGANSGDTVTTAGALEQGFSMERMLASGDGGAVTRSLSEGSGSGYTSLSIASAEDAQSAISAIDSMISYVDSARGDLGASMNRLESTMSVNTNVSINEADAKSRISDADIAEEAANLTAQNILQQAQIAMFTQAKGAKGNMAANLLAG